MAIESELWIEPEPAGASEPDDRLVLSPEQVISWRERGFALVDGVVPQSLVVEARQIAAPMLPEIGARGALRDFGSGGRLEFPTGHKTLDSITLHPRVLSAVSQLLQVPVTELRLTQSDIWVKHGYAEKDGNERSNDDQRIHMDYPNHYLTHPPDWYEPEAVEILLYFDSVENCGGATALVPRKGGDDPAYAAPYTQMPGVGSLRWINDRTAAEAELSLEAADVSEFRRELLYAREARARFGVGTMLLYRHDLWHRGTWLEEGAHRIAQNLSFRRADCEWINTVQPGWAWAMYRTDFSTEKLIARASVAQRCVLGFPAPGHAHWTPGRIEAVRARYGPLGMDMTPYENP